MPVNRCINLTVNSRTSIPFFYLLILPLLSLPSIFYYFLSFSLLCLENIQRRNNLTIV